MTITTRNHTVLNRASGTRGAGKTAAPEPTTGQVPTRALEFFGDLAPSPGFRFPVGDFDKLSPAARKVLEPLSRAHAQLKNWSNLDNFGQPTHGNRNDADLPSTLASKLKGVDVVGVLEKESRRTSLDPLTREAMAGVAEAWAKRASNPGWRAAIAFKPDDTNFSPVPQFSSAELHENAMKAAKEATATAWSVQSQASAVLNGRPLNERLTPEQSKLLDQIYHGERALYALLEPGWGAPNPDLTGVLRERSAQLSSLVARFNAGQAPADMSRDAQVRLGMNTSSGVLGGGTRPAGTSAGGLARLHHMLASKE
jgi:hypothetical protein